MTKVLILNGDSYSSAFEMFKRRGFEPVRTFPQADLLCFLGGTDVDPLLYNCERHPKTQAPDTRRDAFEEGVFKTAVKSGIPMVGSCRGGQLLNVLSGGSMIQHIGYTVSGVVPCFWNQNDDPIDRHLLVDHHQGMLRGEGEILEQFFVEPDTGLLVDYAIYYKKTKALCFQPHPEWGHKGTEDYFFDLIKKHLKMESN